MRIVLVILVGFVSFTGGLSSASAAPTSVVRSALSNVPGDVLTGSDPFAAEVIDLRALRRLARGRPVPPRISGAFGNRFLASLRYDEDAAWARYTGLRPDQPSSFAFYYANNSHRQVTVWQFVDNQEAGLFLRGLQGRGFAERDGEYRNGEPLTFDESRLGDDRNPFADGSGYASVLARRTSAVVQGDDPRIVKDAATFAEERGLTSAASVRHALDAVDDVSTNGTVVQAIVLSPSAWLIWSPPLERFAREVLRDPKKTPEAARAEEARRSAPKAAVPPTLGALLVNVEMSKAHGAVVVLPYADCETAEKAGTIFADLWSNEKNRYNSTARSATGAEPVLRRVKGSRSCSEVISLLVPTPASADAGGEFHENLVWRHILMAMISRDFAPFRI